ncbi:MAG TPA: aldo/keto reductase [Capsulimonadaceae bacterium]|jgi:aryl-alcohol dehydrogenase-like predicted oxidoreductase
MSQATRTTLETRRIGSLDVTVVGIGCNNFGWRIDEAATTRVVNATLDAGINFFDTADVYGGTKSEEFLGRAIKARRDEAIIATKFGHEVAPDKKGAAPAYVRQAVEDSLRRLDTDRIDLYQLHKPDAATPIADTLGALQELVAAGKVREIGCSNFSAAQLREAEATVNAGDVKFVSVQNHYSLLHRTAEAAAIAEAAKLGIGLLPYFPLASGLLTGKYRNGQPRPDGARIQADGRFDDWVTEPALDAVERLIAYASDHGHTLLDLAMAWLLSRPVVASVIAGATTPEQITANAAAGLWRLTETQMAEVEALVAGVEI